MKKTYIIILIVIISVLFGYLVGAFQYKAKYDRLNADFLEMKNGIKGYFPEPVKEIYSYSGVVKSISGSSVVVQINPFPKSYYPWEVEQQENLSLEERVLNLNEDSKIIKRIIPYEPTLDGDVISEEISISDIKEGMNISFSTIENIKTEKNLTVTEIYFNEFEEPNPDQIEFFEEDMPAIENQNINMP